MRKNRFPKGAGMMLGLMSMASAMSVDSAFHSLPPLSLKREESTEQKEARLLKLGHKKFYYGNNYVIALNQKNADKKARKLGYIK
jgi:hypothetical protein